MKKELSISVILLVIFISCTAWYREAPRAFAHTDVKPDSIAVVKAEMLSFDRP